jgi:hypothetical protein
VCLRVFACVRACVYTSLDYEAVNIRELCMDKAMEACAVKCKFLPSIYCILIIYNSLSNNFSLFNAQSETIIIYKPNFQMLICGNFNINYHEYNKKKQKLTIYCNCLIYTVWLTSQLGLEP